MIAPLPSGCRHTDTGTDTGMVMDTGADTYTDAGTTGMVMFMGTTRILVLALLHSRDKQEPTDFLFLSIATRRCEHDEVESTSSMTPDGFQPFRAPASPAFLNVESYSQAN